MNVPICLHTRKHCSIAGCLHLYTKLFSRAQRSKGERERKRKKWQSTPRSISQLNCRYCNKINRDYIFRSHAFHVLMCTTHTFKPLHWTLLFHRHYISMWFLAAFLPYRLLPFFVCRNPFILFHSLAYTHTNSLSDAIYNRPAPKRYIQHPMTSEHRTYFDSESVCNVEICKKKTKKKHCNCFLCMCVFVCVALWPSQNLMVVLKATFLLNSLQFHILSHSPFSSIFLSLSDLSGLYGIVVSFVGYKISCHTCVGLLHVKTKEKKNYQNWEQAR